jgi:hypothetical protein
MADPPMAIKVAAGTSDHLKVIGNSFGLARLGVDATGVTGGHNIYRYNCWQFDGVTECN